MSASTMPYASDDTIAAIATARGGAARGMVRLSGPDTGRIVDACFAAADRRPVDRLSHATAMSGSIDVRLGDAEARRVPCDLFLWPTERSYTRQPVAEFHTFGSEPLLRAVLDAVCRAGARLAEPGEFTLRAFLSGRIDLTQAEAVLGVIDAQHAGQLDTALAQLAGGLARPLMRLRDELVQLLAELEAGLDFVDEGIEFISPDELIDRLAAVADAVRRVAGQMTSRLTQTGLQRVAIVGPPNAGKSSLFNALVARCGTANRSPFLDSPAIVSDQRHTTRDYLTATIDLGRVGCELADTAGVEPQSTVDSRTGTADSRAGSSSTPTGAEDRPAHYDPQFLVATAEAQSVEVRTHADVRALCVDVTSPAAAELLRAMQAASARSPAVDLVVLTKADLVPMYAARRDVAVCTAPVIVTSSVTGQGLDELCDALSSRLGEASADTQATVVAATADRCRDGLHLAEAAVSRAVESAAAHRGDELVAADLRVALVELGKVVGTVYTDDLLDRIFKTFCIGK